MRIIATIKKKIAFSLTEAELEPILSKLNRYHVGSNDVNKLVDGKLITNLTKEQEDKLGDIHRRIRRTLYLHFEFDITEYGEIINPRYIPA